MSRLPEQRRKTGSRVEVRQAEPVDGSVAANESGRSRVSDEPVVLDGKRHGEK